MLRDLFFTIWFDEMGTGWTLFVIFLVIITIIALISMVSRHKLNGQKFSRGHIIFFIISALIIYQIVSVGMHISSLISSATNRNSMAESIKKEKAAITASIIPWQKGGYYCSLATLYLIDRDAEGMKTALDKAYKYTKSYKYPCWKMLFLNFELLGNYDTAIEIALNPMPNTKPLYYVVSGFYIKKGDLKNAMVYIDKDIETEGETRFNLALKAYILKKAGKIQESRNLYIKALYLCKDEKSKQKVKNTYIDYLGYENIRLQQARLQLGL